MHPVFLGRVLASIVLLCAFLGEYWWMRRQSRFLAVLFAAGVTVRVTLGIALFGISLFGLPVLRSLQMGNGFWALAPDAKIYYDLAAHAVVLGLGTISDGGPSPFYVRVLALWMRILGVSPISGMFLNVVCYEVCGLAIVAIGRPRDSMASGSGAGAVVALSAVTFSPALLIFGSQPLKDAMCVMLIVVAIAGGDMWWRDPSTYGPRRHAGTVGGVLLMMVCTYAVAGIRPYAAAFMVITAALAALYRTIVRAREYSHWWSGLQQLSLVFLLGLAFVRGAGSYSGSYESYAASAVNPSTAIAAYDSARAGFVASGGATSLESAAASPASGGASSHEAATARAATRTGRFAYLAKGSMALFVPVSMLRAAGIVNFSGGAGLLLVTDADTILGDLALLASVYLLASSIRSDGILPVHVFVFALAVLTTMSVAYVVINYGTLFRLRLLAAVPFWMLAVPIRPVPSKTKIVVAS
jgi:hypothetical protein